MHDGIGTVLADSEDDDCSTSDFSNGYYDHGGRYVGSAPVRGISIVGGRKVLNK